MRASLLWCRITCALLAASCFANAETFLEAFNATPARWDVYGSFESAFAWNGEAGNLSVTWDSRQPNTFFAYRLPFALRRTDAFSAELRVTLNSLQLGIDPTKPNTFPLCFGFLNLAEATRANYFRGSGVHATYGPRSVVEFAYFPDAGLDATIGPIIASSNNRIAFAHTHPLELAPNETYRIRLAFDPGAQQLHTTISRDGESIGAVRSVTFPASHGDFRIDAFSIHSYSHEGQNPPKYAGSLFATGSVDDILVTYPDPPAARLEGRKTESAFIVSFQAMEGWRYELQRTEDFASWQTVDIRDGVNGQLEIFDETPGSNQSFYRLILSRI